MFFYNYTIILKNDNSMKDIPRKQLFTYYSYIDDEKLVYS